MAPTQTPEDMEIVAPGASPAELEAIRIALGELLPDPPAPAETSTPVWRFSGRWWLDRHTEPPRRTSR
ncbi:MAG: hypothetical protein CL406_07770 [Acidimicrobiaceae bacterium]|nr:hypothetical protein [Acidimicrobiaceae bacterium]